MLPKRRLGRTGLEVSCLGLGAMGVISHYHEGRASAERVVHRALDLGINFIDTAASYFDSEEILGSALATGGRRDKVILATKSMMRRGSRAKAEIDQSFRRMRTDRIDLYQVHHVQYERELEQVLAPTGIVEQLLREKEAGRVRFIGVTSHHPGVLVKALETKIFDTVQFPFNPIESTTFAPVLQKAIELDLGTLAMKPLSGGRLSSIEAALRYCASHPIACTIAGCTTVEHVERDVAALAGGDLPLSDEDRRAVEQEISSLGDLFCRRCRYCEHTCKQGIPIADIFRCHDYLVLNQTYARDEYKKLPGHDRECKECGACEKICPYNLPVREMLKTAHGELDRKSWLSFASRILQATGTYDITRRAFFRLGGARFLPKHRYLHRKGIRHTGGQP
jgi:uncharacterized protein